MYFLDMKYVYIYMGYTVMLVIYKVKQNYNQYFIRMTDSISPVKHRTITSSLERLNRAASQGRFRIKSMMRVKTLQVEQQKCATDRDYQSELIKKMFTKQFLKTLYITRSQQAQLKMSDSKYQAFIRSLHQKVHLTNTFNLASCNFQKSTADMFLNQFINKNQDIISYDLSKCTFLGESQDKKLSNDWIIAKIIRNDKRIVKLVLCNMGFSGIQIKRIFDIVVQTQKIYQLDIGNQNSQSMNRFGDELQLLFEFFKYNSTVSIMGLNNLNIRKNGVQFIQRGISANFSNPLKVLCLKNNGITDQASLHISLIARSGLTELDLSENPLGPKFFFNLPSWKLNTLRKFNLSMTQMNSQSLIFFLSRLEQNKQLQFLKVDANNFSHHWFNQTKQIFQVNTSIEEISFVGCQIKRFSETFLGLMQNRHLKKINISDNMFEDGVKQMSQLIKFNKSIKEIRFRSCGLRPEHFIKIFEALTHNTIINTFDISQNQVGEEGGKQIIKTLNKNNTLCILTHQKTQIPFSIREQIQKKIIANREIKKTRELATLKRENKIVKQSDTYTWDDVEELEAKVRANSKIIASLQSKTLGLEKQYDLKKHRFNEIIKQCKEKQEKLIEDVDNLMKKLKLLETQEQNTLKKYKIRQENLMAASQKQAKSIQTLEQQIRQQSIKNKVRQNQLEDQYQNLKYIQKKKQTKKQSQPKKIGFDATTSINSKRKSKNIA